MRKKGETLEQLRQEACEAREYLEHETREGQEHVKLYQD